MTNFTKNLPTHLLIATLLFFFTNLEINAQKLENGYVISNNGHKYEGQIPENDWEVYSRLVAFNFNNQSKILKPTEINEFGFEGGSIYKAFNLDFNYSTKGGQTYNYNASRFLRQLTFGEIRIYELRDLDVRAWFIQKGDERIRYLSNVKKLETGSKRMLQKAIADCNCIDWDFGLPMRLGVAIELVEEYNELSTQVKNISSVSIASEEVTSSQQ